MLIAALFTSRTLGKQRRNHKHSTKRETLRSSSGINNTERSVEKIELVFSSQSSQTYVNY